MHKNDNHKFDEFSNENMEFLQEMVDAVRHDEPSEIDWQNARRKLSAALEAKPKENLIMKTIQSSYSKPYRWAYAAGFVLLVLSLLVVGNIFDNRSTLAFADVIKQIRSIQTFRCNNSVEFQGNITTMVTEYMEPGKQRTIQPDGNIIIMDMAEGKSLSLIPSQKKAAFTDFSEYPNKQPQGNFIESLQQLEQGAEELLGQSEIDGKTVYGFKIDLVQMKYTVWADVETGLPVQIEVQMEMMGPMTVTMSDFEFNLDFDPADFSTEAPEGYEVITIDTPDMSQPNEEDLINFFTLVVTENDKMFPDSLTMMDVSKRLGLKSKFGNDEPSEEDIQTFTKQFLTIQRGLMFVQVQKKS
jgi:outer membrane lipoprotein-sorting protein